MIYYFNFLLCSYYICIVQQVVVNGSFLDWLSVISGVPQGSVLGPVILLYIDDLHTIVRKLYADDVALYKEIKSEVDCQLLQEDLDRICDWANKCQLQLNILICQTNASQFHLNISSTIYLWHGNLLSSIWEFCSIQSYVPWSDHCKHVSAKASKVLNFLCHTLWGATTEAKSVT